jgi:hypothetical protein
MKRAVLFTLSFAAVMGFARIAAPQQAIAATTPPPIAVLIIACNGAPAATPAVPYTVATVDGSSSSLGIASGGDCAGAVALAKQSGYWIRRINESPTTIIFIMLNTKDEG